MRSKTLKKKDDELLWNSILNVGFAKTALNHG